MSWLALAILQLTGAIVTIIPFIFLPFSPEQTTTHYLVHGLYGMAQLPLVATMIREMRNPPQ